MRDYISSKFSKFFNVFVGVEIVYLLIVALRNLFHLFNGLFYIDLIITFILFLINLFIYSELKYIGSLKEDFTRLLLKVIRKIVYYRMILFVLKFSSSSDVSEVTSVFATLVATGIFIECLKYLTRGKVVFIYILLTVPLIWFMQDRDFVNLLLSTSGIYLLIEWMMSEDFIKYVRLSYLDKGTMILKQEIEKYKTIIIAYSKFVVVSVIIVSYIREFLSPDCKNKILSVINCGMTSIYGSLDFNNTEWILIGSVLLLSTGIVTQVITILIRILMNKIIPKEFKKIETLNEY